MTDASCFWLCTAEQIAPESRDALSAVYQRAARRSAIWEGEAPAEPSAVLSESEFSACGSAERGSEECGSDECSSAGVQLGGSAVRRECGSAGASPSRVCHSATRPGAGRSAGR